ncbi:C-4 sterol methyl oxidase [Chytridiales sp. JEL 0842]|nr:C-4 sterol methyl oxidase [Chytridiales sp. JEL 0842]
MGAKTTTSGANDAMQVVDYYESYKSLCASMETSTIESLEEKLKDAINGGPIPHAFALNGNKDELRTRRLKDTHVDLILKPLTGSSTSFLRELDLSYNEITDEGAFRIAAFLKDDTQLEVLTLKSNSIQSVGGSAIGEALCTNETLCALDLSYNDIGDEGGLQIANMLQVNTSLRRLQLSTCGLRSQSLIALSTVLTVHTSLISIDISNNASNTHRLTASGENDVWFHWGRMMSLNESLREVKMAKMGISDWAVKEFLANGVKVNKSIEVLDLSSNRISRDGGVAICQALYKQPVLRSLNLSCNSIQDEGAEAVCVMLLHNKTLERIYLDHNGIKGKGLRDLAHAIARNRTLTHITLWGNLWDEPSCNKWQSFSKLVGGTTRDLKTTSSLKPAPKPTNNLASFTGGPKIIDVVKEALSSNATSETRASSASSGVILAQSTTESTTTRSCPQTKAKMDFDKPQLYLTPTAETPPIQITSPSPTISAPPQQLATIPDPPSADSPSDDLPLSHHLPPRPQAPADSPSDDVPLTDLPVVKKGFMNGTSPASQKSSYVGSFKAGDEEEDDRPLSEYSYTGRSRAGSAGSHDPSIHSQHTTNHQPHPSNASHHSYSPSHQDPLSTKSPTSTLYSNFNPKIFPPSPTTDLGSVVAQMVLMRLEPFMAETNRTLRKLEKEVWELRGKTGSSDTRSVRSGRSGKGREVGIRCEHCGEETHLTPEALHDLESQFNRQNLSNLYKDSLHSGSQPLLHTEMQHMHEDKEGVNRTMLAYQQLVRAQEELKEASKEKQVRSHLEGRGGLIDLLHEKDGGVGVGHVEAVPKRIDMGKHTTRIVRKDTRSTRTPHANIALLVTSVKAPESSWTPTSAQIAKATSGFMHQNNEPCTHQVKTIDCHPCKSCHGKKYVMEAHKAESLSADKAQPNARMAATYNGTSSSYTPNALESLWLQTFATASNPAITLGAVMFVLHEIVFFGRYLPYMIMEKIPFFAKYKIQPTKKVTSEQFWKVVWHSIRSQLFVQLPMVTFFYPTAMAVGMRFLDVPFPTLTTLFLQQLYFVFCEDTFHYFVHRAMHWGPLYKHIHKIHHEYQAPFGLTAEYAHTLEVLVLGQGFFIGPMTWSLATKGTPNALHVLSVMIWMCVRLILTIDDHSGFDFPWSLHHYLPFWGGADFHDYHHMAFIGNYSSTFRHWDWIFGTDKGYKAWVAKRKAAKADAAKKGLKAE